jgi:hypothetical protein
MSMALGLSGMMPANPDAMNSEEVIQAWRDHAEEIASIEHIRISNRTPEDTGTLDSSITDLLNPNPQTIFEVYFDPAVQLDGPWHRQYDIYQENLPLGHSTYTGDDAQMIWRVRTEDLGVIGAWEKATANNATVKMVANVGEQEIG